MKRPIEQSGGGTDKRIFKNMNGVVWLFRDGGNSYHLRHGLIILNRKIFVRPGLIPVFSMGWLLNIFSE